MFFTQEDYKKIQDWLYRNSVKDTEFPVTNTLNGNEIITIVQEGKNKKVFLKDFADQLLAISNNDFINVSELRDSYKISLLEAIKLVPHKSRKRGQVITFLNTEGLWEIKQFTGKLTQWNEESLWKAFSISLEIPEGSIRTSKLEDEAVTTNKIRRGAVDLSRLNKEVLNKLAKISIPDEEDLEAYQDENSVSRTRLKDRPSTDGMGYVILRKNKTFAEQVTKPNTIYEIRYDFNLGGEEVVIPENCVLNFQGGSLNNGVIIGDKSRILSDLVTIFKSVTITGDWVIDGLRPEWFGAVADGVTDDSFPFKEANRNAIRINKSILLSDVAYKLVGGEIFGGVADNIGTYNLSVIGVVTTILRWYPHNQTDILFNLKGNCHTFSIYGVDISVYNKTGYDSAGVVFSLSSETSAIANHRDTFDKVNVRGNSLTDFVYRIFEINGDTTCDLGWVTRGIFERFKNFFYNNNKEAVGWVFSHCSIYSGAGNTEALIFDYNQCNDYLKVNDCDIALIEGNILLNVERTDYFGRFIFENNRFEGYYDSGQSSATKSISIVANAGVVILKNNNFRAARFGAIALDIKMLGAGRGEFDACYFPNQLNIYTNITTQAGDYSEYKHYYTNCYIYQYNLFFVENTEILSYNDVALSKLFGGIYIDCDTIKCEYLSNNSGAQDVPKHTFKANLSASYTPYLAYSVPKNQMIKKIGLLYSDLNKVITPASLKSVLSVNNTEYIQEMNITSYTGLHDIVLFEGIMLSRTDEKLNVKLQVQNAQGTTTARNCMLYIEYGSQLGEMAIGNAEIGTFVAINKSQNKNNKGTTAQRPTGVENGFEYYDTDLDMPIYWDAGTQRWLGADGFTAGYHKGDDESRPTLTIYDQGFTYWNMSLNKLIVWNGSAWVDATGAEV